MLSVEACAVPSSPRAPTSAESSAGPIDLASILHWLPPALSQPRYRIFASGQAVSLFGNWIQNIALSWLIYRLSGSVFLLGLTGFIQQIPFLVVPPLAGMVADRLPRVRMILAIQVFLAIISVTLAVLAATGFAVVWVYLALAFVIGCANAVEAPTRQSLVGAIVGEAALLPSAIAFHSVLFNLGRMLGPTIAGLLLLMLNEAWCFAINSLTYVAVILAFLRMRLADTPGPAGQGGLVETLRATVTSLSQMPVACYFLPLVASAGFFAAPYQALMPFVAGDVLGGGSGTLGLLIGAAGAGALTSAAYFSFQTGGRAQLKWVQVAPFTLGLAVIGFGLSRHLALSCLCLYLVGASVMLITSSTNTLLQLSVEPGWRGRVIGVFQMSFSGLTPVGSLVAGAIAARLGVGSTFVLNGCLILVVAVIVRAALARAPEQRRALDKVVGG